MFDIEEFSCQLSELIYENRKLKKEVSRLREVEKKYNNFINDTYNSTTKVTEAWVNAIMDGSIKVNIK